MMGIIYTLTSVALGLIIIFLIYMIIDTLISLKRYNELYKSWTEFISSMEIFSLGFKEAEKAAEIYDVLESKGKIIDDNDILIVGIMLSNGIHKIITKNARHFENVENIEVISY